MRRKATFVALPFPVTAAQDLWTGAIIYELGLTDERKSETLTSVGSPGGLLPAVHQISQAR